MKRQRSSVFLTFALGLFLVFSALPAQAAGDILVNDQVTDTDGFLGSSYQQEVRESVNRAQGNGVQLYFVVTAVLDEEPLTTWCEKTAQRSNLPDNALLFALGYANRKYVTCHGPNFPYGDKEITKATSKSLQELKSNPLQPSDVADAFDTFSKAISAADSSSSSSGNPISSLVSASSSSLRYLLLYPLPIVVAMIAFVARRNRNKKLAQTGTAVAGKSLEELVQEATSKLMATDNSVRSAADDLAFAQAQFGQLETTQFVGAVQEAQTHVSNAFVLHTQMTEQSNQSQKRQLATQILDLCQQAEAVLADKVERFNQLRMAGANLPKTIATLRTHIVEAEAKNEVAKAEIESLRTLYSDVRVQSLFDNPGNVTNLLLASKAALEQAEAELAKHTSAGEQLALQQVTIAQRSFGSAISQLNEVMYAADDLKEAPTRLAAAMASLGSDIQDVHRLAPNQAGLHGLVVSAEQALAQANQAVSGSGDVLAALAALRIAEDALDAALAPMRAADEQMQRTQQRFNIINNEVTDLIRQADSYITSHRGGVNQQARTHLATAESTQQRANQQLQAYLARKQFDKAQLDACFNLLYQAKSYAQAAIETASSNVRDSYSFRRDDDDDRYSGRNRQGGGIDLVSLIIGGILASGNSSSSSRSSSSSSSDWGFSGGGFSGGGWSSGGGGWSSSSSGSF
ncbi:MAG: hypothetical protein Q4D73_00180 [Actinomycetaceae bacterium]|nr:hypothetical protein [Actinomycetaceae bacterium]